MPTYEYECNACSHRFEDFQSITEKPRRKCPECGKSSLRRLIGAGGAVIFKGSGFYQTDYRSQSYKEKAAGESKPAADSKPACDKTSCPAKSACKAAAKDD